MLQNVSIQKKTLILLMVTSGTVGLLTCLMFLGYDFLTFKQDQIRKLSTLGEVIASNSTAALAFDNAEDAGFVLSALKAEPHILNAALYDKEGKLFSKYPANFPGSSFPSAPTKDGFHYENSQLIAFYPVAEGHNARLGTLYLKSDLGAVSERLRFYGGIAILVLLISLLAAFAISNITERQISRPILGLAETARAVAHRHDYSVRATSAGFDEIGLLTEAFNSMLTRIGEQNEALVESEERLRTLNMELEKRIEDRTAQLKDANKELESFSYSVSHDLRAPLRHISGFSDLLVQHAANKMDDKSTRYINIIVQAASRMAALIDDILEFSRMGRKEMMKSTVSPNELLQETIANLQDECANRNITWDCHDLPQLVADPSMLRQVFTNLISNAIKYTRLRDSAHIEIGTKQNGDDETIIFVRDNGVGFDMQYASKLFGVFQRLHRMEDFEGTGIGLANVARIIHRHGGRVWAEGKLDEGATFSFSLPKQK